MSTCVSDRSMQNASRVVTATSMLLSVTSKSRPQYLSALSSLRNREFVAELRLTLRVRRPGTAPSATWCACSVASFVSSRLKVSKEAGNGSKQWMVACGNKLR